MNMQNRITIAIALGAVLWDGFDSILLVVEQWSFGLIYN
jgi:hypothetical protein